MKKPIEASLDQAPLMGVGCGNLTTLDPALLLHVLATESHTVQIADNSTFDQIHDTLSLL